MTDHLHKIIYTAMFMALGIVLPFFTGQIPQFGTMMLPMHIPVLLCGFICGWRYGLGLGLALPLVRSLMLGTPPLLPIALAMAVELATYGFLGGFLFDRARWHCLRMLYRSMIIAMLGGRAVWGIAMALLMGFQGQTFSWELFVLSAFVHSLPGIVLQLVLIPAVLVAVDKVRRGS